MSKKSMISGFPFEFGHGIDSAAVEKKAPDLIPASAECTVPIHFEACLVRSLLKDLFDQVVASKPKRKKKVTIVKKEVTVTVVEKETTIVIEIDEEDGGPCPTGCRRTSPPASPAAGVAIDPMIDISATRERSVSTTLIDGDGSGRASSSSIPYARGAFARAR